MSMPLQWKETRTQTTFRNGNKLIFAQKNSDLSKWEILLKILYWPMVQGLAFYQDTIILVKQDIVMRISIRLFTSSIVHGSMFCSFWVVHMVMFTFLHSFIVSPYVVIFLVDNYLNQCVYVKPKPLRLINMGIHPYKNQ